MKTFYPFYVKIQQTILFSVEIRTFYGSTFYWEIPFFRTQIMRGYADFVTRREDEKDNEWYLIPF